MSANVLAAVLLLAADAGGGAPAGGRPIGISGVPGRGLSGSVASQSVSPEGVVSLFLEGAEVRVARWPDRGVPPGFEHAWLVATTRLHPEGPSSRIEIGPEKGMPLWILGTTCRVQCPLVAGARLGHALAQPGTAPRVPILQAGREVARLRPGETTVLRDDKGRWCLGIASITMPEPPTPGIADEFRAPQVDFFARRLQGKTRSCRSTAGG